MDLRRPPAGMLKWATHFRRAVLELYWAKREFQELVADRVDFALARYFMRRRLQQAIYYSEELFTSGISVEPSFADNFWIKHSLLPAERRPVGLEYQGTEHKVEMGRNEVGTRYYIDYSKNQSLISTIRENLAWGPQEGDKVFLLVRKGEKVLELLNAA